MAIHESKKEIVASLESIIPIVNKMGVQIEEFDPGFVKVRLPKDPNVNHIGTVYAGSLFSLADYTGGILFGSCFNLNKYYPILKEVTISFKRPATTDVTVEVSLSAEEIIELEKVAETTGKADCIKNIELKDSNGSICCIARGTFQVRKVKG
jgi:thioesterase domain-containing protein